MNRAILFKDCGMEALYVKDRLVAEGNPINKGERAIYFANLAGEFGFNLKEMNIGQLTKKGMFLVDKNGGYPDNIEKLENEYWYDQKTLSKTIRREEI